MRILLWSNSFHPSVGGLEAVSGMLAEEFARQGHQVTLVTRTASTVKDEFPFAVVRRPSWHQMFRLVKQCDVYLQNHISLKAAWPLLFVRRPWVVAHHTWIPRSGLKGRIKHFMLRFARSISCSNEIAAHVKSRSTVICSPYDDRVFRRKSDVQRDKDLIFVGRLSREKGASVLVDALRLLKSGGHAPSLTIVGGGPERSALARQAEEFGFSKQVEFAGSKAPLEVADLLNQHRILVVPSLYREPFGVVALEGIACGCAVVGSEGGGLKDAIGPCGATFPNGDAPALAGRLARLLQEPDAWRKYSEGAATHLRSFTRAAVANSYLNVLRLAYESAGA
jgi:glycogen(starch) synthase